MGNVSLELPILERSAVRVFSAMIGSVLSKAYTVLFPLTGRSEILMV